MRRYAKGETVMGSVRLQIVIQREQSEAILSPDSHGRKDCRVVRLRLTPRNDHPDSFVPLLISAYSHPCHSERSDESIMITVVGGMDSSVAEFILSECEGPRMTNFVAFFRLHPSPPNSFHFSLARSFHSTKVPAIMWFRASAIRWR